MMDSYQALYDRSIADPNEFWLSIAKQLSWKHLPEDACAVNYNFNVNQGPIFIKWMEGAITNVCYNVLDRVIDNGFGGRIAYHWEDHNSNNKRDISYNELKVNVCKFANVLKKLKVKQGDRIGIYMSMTIDLVVAMLSCARIGAIHTVVFAGFSSEALADRLIDANCSLLITSDGAFRGEKFIPLKSISDLALNICQHKGHQINTCVVQSNLNLKQMNEQKHSFNWNKTRDYCWTELMESVDEVCEPVWVSGEHPLFIMYTSGSTGKPKGILHTTGGYMLYTYTTFKYAFNYTDGDVLFPTADLGWMAGHSMTVYGALANGASIVMIEGTPLEPDPSRIWRIVEKQKVNILFTAPTVIRALMKFGEQYVKPYNRKSLRVVAVAGETMNPEAWHWSYNVVGEGRCHVVDNYWQTETSGPMITSMPGYTSSKPGSATFPFFGVSPAVLDDKGIELEGEATGHLVYKKPWPGIARTIDGKHDFFEKTYFEKFIGYYWTGDKVRRDSEGYYWICGRVDDTLNVSGHLLSIVEVETAIVEHRSVSEAAAVSVAHSVKGDCVHAFVVLNSGLQLNDELISSIKQRVRQKIGPHAVPDFIIGVNELPKTKSGKIVRRILQKIAAGEKDFGDISTLADESVLDELIKLVK